MQLKYLYSTFQAPFYKARALAHWAPTMNPTGRLLLHISSPMNGVHNKHHSRCRIYIEYIGGDLIQLLGIYLHELHHKRVGGFSVSSLFFWYTFFDPRFEQVLGHFWCLFGPKIVPKSVKKSCLGHHGHILGARMLFSTNFGALGPQFWCLLGRFW